MNHLLERLRNRSPELDGILKNIGWLSGERLLRLFVGFFVTIILARHLGPAAFGLLNLALVVVSLFAPLATLGLRNIIIKELILRPNDTATIIGTTLGLQFVAGIAAGIAAIFAATKIETESSLLFLVLIIVSIPSIRATDCFKHWYESKVQSKRFVLVEGISSLLCNLAKVLLVLGNAPLIAFAYAFLAEAILVAFGVSYIFQRNVIKISELRWNSSRALDLLKQSWPLLLSGLAVIFYMKIDQVMLGMMLNTEAVGIYSIAVRLSELWHFIPMAVISSTFPRLLNLREKSRSSYFADLKYLYRIMIMASIGVATITTILSTPLVTLFFGPQFEPASTILSIHIWGGVFVVLGLISGQWLIAEGMQRFDLYRTLSGACVNIVLNFILIPRFGCVGAALATIAAQSWAALWFDLIHPSTRLSFRLKIHSLLPIRK